MLKWPVALLVLTLRYCYSILVATSYNVIIYCILVSVRNVNVSVTVVVVLVSLQTLVFDMWSSLSFASLVDVYRESWGRHYYFWSIVDENIFVLSLLSHAINGEDCRQRWDGVLLHYCDVLDDSNDARDAVREWLTIAHSIYSSTVVFTLLLEFWNVLSLTWVKWLCCNCYYY